MGSQGSVKHLTAVFIFLLLVFSAAGSFAASPAGYSEFYIPGDESLLGQIFSDIGAAGPVALTAPRHTVINIVAWSPNTTIYYDHWEDGYDFDPNNPSTADETVVVVNRGDSYTFESANIPVNPRGTTTYYDGRDRIYVAGGTVTVTRESWIDSVGTVFQIAWEVYPVRPQMTVYILPFGDDLAGAPRNYLDFKRVFALVQATTDSTVVTFDVNNDGVYGDTICTSHSNPCTATATQVALNAGEVFLLDRFAALPTTGSASLTTGTKVLGSETLQVNYIIGDQAANYEARGFSAFPRGFWDDEYYAPVPTDNGANFPTQIYLYNPQSTVLTVTYETASGSGSFTIPAGQTRSFSEMTGGYVPQGSGVYLKGSDVFWGISTIDTQGQAHEWGYSLVPAFLLDNEHYLGWALGAYPASIGEADDSGIFITPAQDNTRVFIDTNHDGTPDQTYTLSRLQTQYVYDATDGDLSNTNIWATGPVSIAFGQNPDTSPAGTPAIDLGYTVLPAADFVDRVLTMDKSANPVVVPTAAGSQSTYTLIVDSYKYPAANISVQDTLPAGWQYVNNSTTITRADKTTVSGAPANPTISGGGLVLAWPSSVLNSMAPNQQITITFTAQTTMAFPAGTITRNIAEATGTRTVGGLPQTFVTSDFAFNTYGNLTVSKTSSATGPLYPADQFTYTVTVTNPSASAITDVSVYDALPSGLSYVGPLQVSRSTAGDRFDTAAYNNQNGTANWVAVWTEANDGGNDIQIVNGMLQLDNSNSNEPTIRRRANLTGATSATLVFDYQTGTGVDAGDIIYIEAATADAGPFTIIGTFTGITGATSGSFSGSLNAYISANTTIRFRFANNDYRDANEFFYVDNLFITYDVPVTNATIIPPDLIDGYTLLAGQNLTVSFPVMVDSPLSTGIESITNTASANAIQILLAISASVTNVVVNPSSGSAEIISYVWLDSDSDGIKDIGEPGLANVEVTLKDQFGTPIATATTDGTGRYVFAGIEPGNGYYVEVTAGTLPAGLTQSAPAGHSDNRTNAFNLAAGQSYTTADLGYKPAPGTATLGDSIWSDADGNGTRDPGEPGLAGVTAQLWLDVNDNGVIEPGTDVLTASTVTAPGGSYLFAGVAATGTEDYIVFVDNTQAALTGFSQTTVDRNIKNISANSVFTNLDFGFRNSPGTYTIEDRIWNDLNVDNQDDGEAGIAAVTVDLLDASRNVIATAITDATGYFSFNGVIGSGADYTVMVTDTSGVLNNYYGITNDAKAGEVAINNVSANLDFTVEPTEPHFGYGLNRSIGGTTFNDLNGNGVWNAGEPGISGIAVRLYNDVNGNSLLDGGDTLKATLVSDSDGDYLFSGLANGNYIVSIPTLPAGYAYTTESPDNDPAAGSQRPAVIAAGGTVLNLNFGYQAIIPRSVSGTVWEDADMDGVVDATEKLFQGVTIEALDTGVVIATTSTDASGNYTFSGLTAKTYTVRITDASGILAGYTEVYENDGVLDGQTALDLSGGNVSNMRFGYALPGVTFVALSSFRGYDDNGRLRLEWSTSAQTGTAGFFLLRLDTETGRYTQINRDILPALLSSPHGGIYSLIDTGAPVRQRSTYMLEEVEARGNRNLYGPFTVMAGKGSARENSFGPSFAAPGMKLKGTGGGSPEDGTANPVADEISGYSMTPRQISSERQARLAAAQAGKDKARYLRKIRKGTIAKISVDKDGLYFIDAEDISAMLGIPRDEVSRLIRNGSIALRNLGKKVAYIPAEDYSGIFFYGRGIDSLYTKENIYWLYRGKGLIVKQRYGSGPLPAGYSAFTETVHAEEETMFLNTDMPDPEGDYWFWTYLYVAPGFTDLSSNSFVVRTEGVADVPATATLTVHLKGFTDTAANPDHHIRVSLNGAVVGEGWLDGMDAEPPVVIQFDQRLLWSGDNTIKVEAVLDPGVPYSAFYIDSFDVTYQRLHMAAGNALTFTAEAAQPLTVYGFTNASIMVFDITDPNRPVTETAATVQDEGGTFSVSFIPSAAGTRYHVMTPDASIAGAEAWVDTPSRLSAKVNAADYLIIAPDFLKDAAQVLADYRMGQGYRTMIVDIEDIMDEFNHGMYSPHAIRNFLVHALTVWDRAPRYVVLAGEGTYDYKDNMGMGDNLIPTMIVSTPSGLFPSDTFFADADGDHVPDLAIGRLPVLTEGELQDLVHKMIVFENTAGTRVMMLADNADFDGNYPSDSDDLTLLVPQRLSVDKLYLPFATAAYIRDVLLQGIPAGTMLMSYMGHGNPFTLADEGLLTVPDVELMNNSGRPFVLTAMTCAAGDFGFPGYDALSEALIMKKDGGAVAVLAPSGLALNALSKTLGEGFFSDVFTAGNRMGVNVLGDAVREAFRFYKSKGGADFTLDIYNLLGDPALRMRTGSP